MRCAEPGFLSVRANRGGAVIMAMLTVALVAGLAAAILSDYGNAVTQLSGRHDLAQARWLARGAVDWARNVLEDDYRRGGANPVDYLGEEWAIKVPPTPVDEGEVSGEIEDWSGRFNLNSIVVSGQQVDKHQLAVFVRLLENVGVDNSRALQLGNAVVDWIDGNEEVSGAGGAETAWYHSQNLRPPPQGYFLDPAELQAVRGFDAALVELLRPHLSALPASVRTINVNTASAEVLSAHVEQLSLSDARAIVTTRDRSFFPNRTAFTDLLPKSTAYDASQFDVRSVYFLATGRARWGDAVTRMQVLLRRSQARPDILWRKNL